MRRWRPRRGPDVRAPRAVEHQRLVEADAAAPVGQRAQPLGLKDGSVGGCIEDDEVVADAMHLREIDAHRAASIAESAARRDLRRAGLESEQR